MNLWKISGQTGSEIEQSWDEEVVYALTDDPGQLPDADDAIRVATDGVRRWVVITEVNNLGCLPSAWRPGASEYLDGIAAEFESLRIARGIKS